jgi:aspartate kinase
LDDRAEKIEKVALGASELFDVQVTKGLSLLTIRHYNDAIVENMIIKPSILLRQQTPETIQVLMKTKL